MSGETTSSRILEMQRELEACARRYLCMRDELRQVKDILIDPNRVFEASMEISRVLARIEGTHEPALPELVRKCRQYRVDNQHPIQELLRDAKQVMEELLKCVSDVTAAVEGHRDRMLPRLDGAIQESRATRAYSLVNANRFQ